MRPDTYHAPQGVLNATPDQLRHWSRQWREMNRCGLKVPVSWLHHPDALPGYEKDRLAKPYYLSRYNAGYVKRLGLNDKGELAFDPDAPGCFLDGDKLACWTKLPDGREVKTAIGDVSVAIKDFTDGQGRLWKNSIVHVALTPTPVAHGHGGFTALSLSGGYAEIDPDEVLELNRGLNRANSAKGFYTLSLSQTEDGMADEEEDFGGEEETTPPMVPPPAPPPPEPAGMNYFPMTVEYLREHCGLALLPDTTPENFMERVCVACHQKAKGGKVEGEADGMNGEDEGAEYTGEEGLTAEEPRPVMMSLSTAGITPRDRVYLDRETRRHKAALSARIDALAKGGLPKHLADGYRARLEGYTLSLNADTLDPVEKKLDHELSLAESLLTALSQRKGESLKGAKPAAQPPSRQPINEPTDEEIQERARRVSAKQ